MFRPLRRPSMSSRTVTTSPAGAPPHGHRDTGHSGVRRRSSRPAAPSVLRSAAVLAAVLALAGAGVGPAVARPGDHPGPWRPHTVDVVNMGDSISAGIGSGDVVDSEVLAPCLQGSGRNHVDQLTDHRRFDLRLDLSCGGLTTGHVKEVAQHPDVAGALADAELITLTMGANDVQYLEFIDACGWAGDSAQCDALVAEVPDRIAAAAASSGDTLAALDELTDAEVIHLGYAHLFDGDTDNAWLSAERAAQLNHYTDVLNAALAREARANGATFVDVTRRFDGHGAESERPWIYFSPDDREDMNNLHPNTRGYVQGYYPALHRAAESVLRR